MDNSNFTSDTLFKIYDDTPTETDPFCNYTEYDNFNESYSEVIPTFFFRDKKCSIKPSSYEKKKLRYFYNITGLLLSAKFIIEISIFLLFSIITFLISFSFTSSLSLYSASFSDYTIQYSFKTISLIISTLSVFFAGCRYSSLKPADLIKSKVKLKTEDVIFFFMAALFVISIQNICNMSFSYLTGDYNSYGLHLKKDILHIVSAAIYTCIVIPVSDGLIFRGIMLKNLSRVSQHFGIIMTSILCALSTVRFQNIIPAFLLSLLMAKLTVKCNSVTPSIIINIITNISSMIISVYGIYAWNSDTTITKLWTAITFITGGFFAAVSILKYPLPKSNKLQKKRTLPLFLTSVFILLIFILYITAASANLLKSLYL